MTGAVAGFILLLTTGVSVATAVVVIATMTLTITSRLIFSKW
jgi:hypothetical protein